MHTSCAHNRWPRPRSTLAEEMTGRGKEHACEERNSVYRALSLVPWKSRKPRAISTFPQLRLLLSTGSQLRTQISTRARKKCQLCARFKVSTLSPVAHHSAPPALHPSKSTAGLRPLFEEELHFLSATLPQDVRAPLRPLVHGFSPSLSLSAHCHAVRPRNVLSKNIRC